MSPVFQFTFFVKDDHPDVYIVTNASNQLEAHIALWGAREFELPDPYDPLEIVLLTTNSVIKVENG